MWVTLSGAENTPRHPAFLNHATKTLPKRCPTGEVKGLKAQCNSLADAAQSEKFELLAAKQENERLHDQIVQVGGQGFLGSVQQPVFLGYLTIA